MLKNVLAFGSSGRLQSLAGFTNLFNSVGHLIHISMQVLSSKNQPISSTSVKVASPKEAFSKVLTLKRHDTV